MSKIFVRIMSNFILVDQKDNSSGNENVSIVLFFFFLFFLFFFLEEDEGEGGGGNYLLFFVCLFRYLLPSHITVCLQELVIHLQECDEGIYRKANIA